MKGCVLSLVDGWDDTAIPGRKVNKLLQTLLQTRLESKPLIFLLQVRMLTSGAIGDLRSSYVKLVAWTLFSSYVFSRFFFFRSSSKDMITTHREPVMCVKYNSSFKHIITASENSVSENWSTDLTVKEPKTEKTMYCVWTAEAQTRISLMIRAEDSVFSVYSPSYQKTFFLCGVWRAVAMRG